MERMGTGKYSLSLEKTGGLERGQSPHLGVQGRTPRFEPALPCGKEVSSLPP